MRYLLLLIFPLLLAASCGDDEAFSLDEIQPAPPRDCHTLLHEMPDTTAPGLGVFGARLNGEIWTAWQNDWLLGGLQYYVKAIPQNWPDPADNEYKYRLHFRRLVEADHECATNDQKIFQTLDVYIRDLYEGDHTDFKYTSQFRDNQSDEFYWIDTTAPNQLRIDTIWHWSEASTVYGTLHMDFINEADSRDTIRIREGVFAINTNM